MKTKISAEHPDWTRERCSTFSWQPGKKIMMSIRRYQSHVDSRASEIPIVGGLIRKIYVLNYRFWSVVSGADIPLNCKIEGGLLLPHPQGVVINPGAQIGPNCLMMSQVVIGGHAIIEGHVDFGTGVKVIGDYTIGRHSVIGANAVVKSDVPKNSTAVGIPAKVIRSSS